MYNSISLLDYGKFLKMKSVTKFIKTEATFLCKATYNKERYGWDMPSCLDKTPGVYFIVKRMGKNLEILKVGKAEGKKGLHQRIGQYRSSGVGRINGTNGKYEDRYDRSVITIHNAMLEVEKVYGENVELEFYIHGMPKLEVLYKGYKLESSIIRSLELELSLQAKKEGHSMLLSGQD